MPHAPNNADLWKKFRRVCRLLASGAVFFLSAKHLFLAAKPRSDGVRAVGVFRALCNQC